MNQHRHDPPPPPRSGARHCPGSAPRRVPREPRVTQRLRAIMQHPSYREADSDTAFLHQDAARGVRLQADYLKAELVLAAHGIERTVLVYGSTRLREPENGPARAGRRAGSGRQTTRRCNAGPRGATGPAPRGAVALLRGGAGARPAGRACRHPGPGGAHRRRSGRDGGGQPRRQRRRRDDRGPEHHAAARAVPQSLRHARTVLALPLFRDAQAALSDARRARSSRFPAATARWTSCSRRTDPGPDPQDASRCRSCWSARTTGGAVFDVEFLVDEGSHRSGRPRTVLVRRDRPRSWQADPATGHVRERQPACSPSTATLRHAHETILSRCRSRRHRLLPPGRSAGKRILVDCGLYQGGRELDEENAGDFGFDPASHRPPCCSPTRTSITAGACRCWSSAGFAARSSPPRATRELARAGAARRGPPAGGRRAIGARASAARRGLKRTPPCTARWTRSTRSAASAASRVYGEPLELAPGLRATFLDAGHILGSASIRSPRTATGGAAVLFSGDLGNGGRPLLRDPQTPPQADVVVMETTYGDRLHSRSRRRSRSSIAAITDTFERGGNVIIPTFALERAQELLYYLREGVEKRPAAAQPAGVPRFADGDLRHRDLPPPSRVLRRRSRARCSRAARDPFALPGLHFTRETAESMAHQPHRRRRGHHGRFGHVHRRARAPPPAAQPLARGFQRRIRRLCRGRARWRAHHRRRQGVRLFDEQIPVRAAIAHDQRLLGPRRPRRTAGLAAAHAAGADHPRARRRGGDAGLRPHLAATGVHMPRNGDAITL